MQKKLVMNVLKNLLAQAKSYFDGVRVHRFVPVKILQRLHTFRLPTLSMIAIPNYGCDHLLARSVFVAIFQRLVTGTLEV